MLKLTSKTSEIQVFVNSFTGGGSSLEAAHSRRILYLLESKKHMIDKFTVVDVNTEIKKALSEKYANESTTLIRETLISQFKLIRNGSNSEVVLPQVFLVRNKLRHYLGDYLTLQYLEDCGLLVKLLSGELCPHYRIYKSQVYYRHSVISGKQLSCLECVGSEIPITLETSYQDPLNLESHELCLFFERNRLPFRLQSPNSEEGGPIYTFKESSARHRIFIHQNEVSLE